MAGIAASALLSSLAITMFVRPANLIPAGISGLTMLIQRETFRIVSVTLPYGILYLIINIILLSLVFKHLGKRFMMLSLLHVLLTSFFVDLLPVIKLTEEPVLLAIFGGVVNGLAITIALKTGGSTGGTDFVAIYFSSVKNRPMWDKIMFFNIMMLVYNGWQYNWTLSFYSMIYQFASTEILSNYHDRYKLSSLRVITNVPTEVSAAILAVTRHGITQFEGKGVYSGTPKSMLYVVVNSFEIKYVLDAIKNADSKAFIEIASVDRIEGNYRQKPLD